MQEKFKELSKTFKLGGIIINNIYEKLNITSDIAIIIISIALMLFLGFLMTRITKKLRLPNVTAYIVTGILIGPYVLNLIPQKIIDGTAFLSDIALAFIAFSTGEFFRFSTIKKNGPKVVIITLLEALLASILVFVVMYFILHLNLAFSIVLASLHHRFLQLRLQLTQDLQEIRVTGLTLMQEELLQMIFHLKMQLRSSSSSY